METTNLIDGNSLGFAAHSVTKLTVNGLQTQAIFNFIKMMRQLKQDHPSASNLVLWDGKAQWRYDLYPNYKAKRNENPKMATEREAYKQQRPYIERALKCLGVTQMVSLEHEADDLAGLMTKRLMSKPDNAVRLITGDQDWLQLLRENVVWQDLRSSDRLININNFFEKTGYKTPMAFLEGKVLHGDPSDCITGVGGIGETGAPLFIAEHGSVGKFWKKCDNGTYTPRTKAERSLWKGDSTFTKEEWESQFVFTEDEDLSPDENEKARKKALKKHMDCYVGQGRLLYGRNLKLMQLFSPKPLSKDKLIITKGEFNRDEFLDLCGELAFMSIIKTADTFLKPFER